MKNYKIELNTKLLKILEKIPKQTRIKIIERLDALKNNPRPRWIEKLASRSGYRIAMGSLRPIQRVELLRGLSRGDLFDKEQPHQMLRGMLGRAAVGKQIFWRR